MEPLSVGVHVVKRLKINFSTKCIIFGCGAIGLVCAAVARAKGASKILMIDANESRMKFAKKYVQGIETYLPPKPEPGESKMECKNSAAMKIGTFHQVHESLIPLDSKRNAAKILSSYDWLAEGAPAVIDATGAEVCTQTAILVTRKNGIFIQAGMYPHVVWEAVY